MNDGEDWLMRPVLEGLCKYESLLDGTLSLEDLQMMHESLDVKYENDRRYMEYEKAKQKIK
jgi:hypothetical protein